MVFGSHWDHRWLWIVRRIALVSWHGHCQSNVTRRARKVVPTNLRLSFGELGHETDLLENRCHLLFRSFTQCRWIVAWVIETCRQQSRNVFQFLTTAIEAHFANQNAPSLASGPRRITASKSFHHSESEPPPNTTNRFSERFRDATAIDGSLDFTGSDGRKMFDMVWTRKRQADVAGNCHRRRDQNDRFITPS